MSITVREPLLIYDQIIWYKALARAKEIFQNVDIIYEKCFKGSIRGMQVKIKRHILDMIQTMLEAHKHIMKLLQNKRIVQANDLLVQCQECACHIGDSIEQSEGEGSYAVCCLESYCEKLYDLSRTIGKKEIIKIVTQLDETLCNVKCEVEENISISKLKIVFMPYKFSMWDCMESVWEAAVNDEECEVKVVPIPYYERNQQGGYNKLCYEGDLFPKDIPVIPYEAYSLEVERPDIVYIHNPYDDKNYVTSVHPDFYSSNLKKYVQELVYIPYYINGEGPMPETHRVLPAYRYADKIIVQDEDKKESLSEYVPKEKVIAIGSPKADRILKLEKKKKEIIEHYIPLEWKAKIEGKKVILFNISITGLLQNSNFVMEKIRYIIQKFNEQEKVVMLWRPHPLIEATLSSMRPEMYKEYLAIKNEFLHNGKGIFDDTEDAGIACVLADAYLGENTSSLVHYFGVLGKPILYINWGITDDKQKQRGFLNFYTFYTETDNIFFVPANSGLSHDLYQLNLSMGSIKKVLTFPGNLNNVWGCYMGIKKIYNKIVLIPAVEDDIYIYDIEKKQAVKIVLSESLEGKESFDEAVEYNGKIFLLPKCYPAIVSVNIKNLEVCEFKDCVKSFTENNGSTPAFLWAYFKKENYLYLASCNESRILIFNMKNGSYEIKKIGDYSYGYSDMLYDGKQFWLAAYKANYIICWDEKTGDTRKYTYPFLQEQPEDQIYSWLLNKEKEVIVCYGRSMNIVSINKKTGEYVRSKICEIIFDKTDKKTDESRRGIIFAKHLNKEWVLLFVGEEGVKLWNIYTDEWKSFLVYLPKEELLNTENKLINKFCISRGVPYSLSEHVVSVPQFIDYIEKGDTDIFQKTYECYQVEGEGTVGARVHEYIKDAK